MGDIADMMLDGTLDCITGEYMGSTCGYPRTYEGRRRKTKGQKNRVPTPCPECGKRVKKMGLKDHRKNAHGVTD